MKGLILTLAAVFSAGAFATTGEVNTCEEQLLTFDDGISEILAGDAASEFVFQTMTRGKQIMELKSDAERFNQMCALVKSKVHSTHIGSVWLGRYAQLAREKAAVQQFYAMIPNIIMTKAIDGAGNSTISGSFKVNPKSVARGNNVYAVGVQVTDAKGKSYNGKAIVVNNGGWRIMDGEYLGFSAVKYTSRDYQDFLNREYNKDPNNSMPVTALIKSIKSESGYVTCP